jgi:hypothetical protein
MHLGLKMDTTELPSLEFVRGSKWPSVLDNAPTILPELGWELYRPRSPNRVPVEGDVN